MHVLDRWCMYRLLYHGTDCFAFIGACVKGAQDITSPPSLMYVCSCDPYFSLWLRDTRPELLLFASLSPTPQIPLASPPCAPRRIIPGTGASLLPSPPKSSSRLSAARSESGASCLQKFRLLRSGLDTINLTPSRSFVSTPEP